MAPRVLEICYTFIHHRQPRLHFEIVENFSDIYLYKKNILTKKELS